MRKLIFLDFDGVLNSHDHFNRRGQYPLEHKPEGEPFTQEDRDVIDDWDICGDNISQLNRLVESTGAEVVVSSTWRSRSVEHLQDILTRNGFVGKVIGKTPFGETKLPSGIYVSVQRGDEIQTWLDENCQDEEVAFVILDDDSDMAHLKDRLVKTSMFEGGLCVHHVEAAIEMLAKKWEGRVTKS